MNKFSVLFICTLAALCSATSVADFNWFNTATNRVAYQNGTSFLTGSSSSSAGCFVQLVWAGPDNSIDPARSWEDGATDDDQVQATTWIGNNILGNPFGRYSESGFSTDSNGYYYVRFWTAPAHDYALGTVPLSSTNYYADTDLWLNPGSEPPASRDSFNNIPYDGYPTNQTPLAIPEPTTFVLAMIGLLFLRKKLG